MLGTSDLREKVIQAYHDEKGSLRGVAKLFSVSLNFVWLLLERFRETGSVAPKPHGGGPTPKMTPECLDILEGLVEACNDATLLELREQLYQKTGQRVSRETITRGLKRLRITRKKKTFHATERENNPDIIEERETFIQAMPEMNTRQLHVIDECGINLGMARPYARALQGQRARAHRPADRGGNVTLIAALTPQGIKSALMIPGSLDGGAFKTYVQKHCFLH